MKKLVYLILLSCNHLYSEACLPSSINHFNSILSSHVKPVTLIFFSTWCSDCKVEIEKIKNDKNENNYILIAEYDSLQRVERSLKKLNIETECYFDKDASIKSFYGVKLVPTVIVIK